MTGLTSRAVAFVQEAGCPGDGWDMLAADASPRRYFRHPKTPFGSCLLMVTEPNAPELEAYLQIATHLNEIGLSAPTVYLSDISSGLALIEDFGNGTFTSLLSAGMDEDVLYETGVDALVWLHQHPKALQIDLPAYDIAPLMQEVRLFADWFAPSMAPGRDLAAFSKTFDALWRDALAGVARRRETLVLRDYHVDNLMLLENRTGAARCGLLDFQDALIGSAAYDVISLTQDARRDISPELERSMLKRYLAAQPELGEDQFLKDYHLLAAQRHTKVAGIFHRLAQRDGKTHYLAHMPRVLRLLDKALQDAGLHDMRALIDRHLPGWNSTVANLTLFRQDTQHV